MTDAPVDALERAPALSLPNQPTTHGEAMWSETKRHHYRHRLPHGIGLLLRDRGGRATRCGLDFARAVHSFKNGELKILSMTLIRR